MKKRLKEKLVVIAFLGIVFLGISLSFVQGIRASKHLIDSIISGNVVGCLTTFESEYESAFNENKWALNSYSIIQKLLCKREARNFEVLKANDGQLFLQNAGWPIDEDVIADCANRISAISEVTEENGGSLLFVQVPYKNAGMKPELKYYSDDDTEKAEDELINLLGEDGIACLDLRPFNECSIMYKTDHHWTTEACFDSAKRIVEELDENPNMDFAGVRFLGDKGNYYAVKYENALLGSIGVKVGPFFSGMDDFTVYNPRFETQLKLNHYIDGELDFSCSGSFWDAFIDENLLNDKNYYNKYNSLLYGSYVEAVIQNENSNNEYKALLVTHSYGRGLAQYLSLYFKELRYIDPQPGRFQGSICQYIEEYHPNVVIIMYNDLLNITN